MNRSKGNSEGEVDNKSKQFWTCEIRTFLKTIVTKDEEQNRG
jgi:hypothetical protein